MFNIVEKHQKLVKGLMIVITGTFVMWGVSGYLSMGDDGYVAKVGSKKIYGSDIDQAMDQSKGQSQDKMQVLFGLINRQLLVNSLEDNYLVATTPELRDEISAVPLFQTNGQFDKNKYQDFLKQRYTTSAKFEKDIEQQVLIMQMVDFFKNSYFTSNTFQDKFIQLLSRERNVSSYVIDPKTFYAKINPSESDIAIYYQQNIGSFTIPEQAKLQYLELSLDTVTNSVNVSNDEINAYLKDHPNTGTNKEIDVSHILLSVPDGANASQKAQIKAKAAQVLTQVKANPAKFAQLAKEYSQDPGSAEKGGDLGYFGRGVMVKPFESAAFAMKVGEISSLVETQYGYHILKLNAVKGDNPNSVKDAAIVQLKKQKAQQQLQGLSDQLNDLTYKQADSLEPAAKKLGLSIQTTGWINKNTQSGLFADPKLQKAVFSDDVIKGHHNSTVVDLGNASYVVARVVQYEPLRMKGMNEVKPQIVDAIKSQKASQMAGAMAQQNLMSLQQGKLKLKFDNPQDVSLIGQNKEIDASTVKQIFAATAKFPGYISAPGKNGSFVIYQINGQSYNKNLNDQNKKMVAQLADQYSTMTLNSYVGSLRSQYSVNYKLDRIQNTDQSASGGVPVGAAGQAKGN